MELRQLVEKYLAAAGASGFGASVPLSAFGLSREETDKQFSALDEDYQISRFFRFSQRDGTSFSINGFPQTHIAIAAAIQTIL
jgi:hypothetical protein